MLVYCVNLCQSKSIFDLWLLTAINDHRQRGGFNFHCEKKKKKRRDTNLSSTDCSSLLSDAFYSFMRITSQSWSSSVDALNTTCPSPLPDHRVLLTVELSRSHFGLTSAGRIAMFYFLHLRGQLGIPLDTWNFLQASLCAEFCIVLSTLSRAPAERKKSTFVGESHNSECSKLASIRFLRVFVDSITWEANWELDFPFRLALLYSFCVYRFSLSFRSATAISDVARACRSKKLARIRGLQFIRLKVSKQCQFGRISGTTWKIAMKFCVSTSPKASK